MVETLSAFALSLSTAVQRLSPSETLRTSPCSALTLPDYVVAIKDSEGFSKTAETTWRALCWNRTKCAQIGAK